ncbi:MAG: bifunctional pyr operon transcriptional regulator/uracil phosphoribosyltransferase PyrR [Nitrospiraceae bacterium]|nr:bifunctional pyr operon transcriptional regulator/uracil phosphoribosyltransferase PyrR [Nitrospiraceae bacterium]
MTVVMDGERMADTLRRLAREICADNPDIESLALLGILKRGRPLADRLAGLIGEMSGVTPPVGSLATTLYRDDLRAGVGQVKFDGGATHFDFALDDKTVVLVDDVLAAGRTIRAAMDEVMDYGRPARIQLACLMDRGGRELPIQPDYLGEPVGAKPHEYVSVRMVETDGEDVVVLEHRSTPDEGGE